jgi:phosphate transport system permease protein
MLAIARAAGETAALLFTIGSVSALHLSVQGQNTTLATQIYSNITQSGGEQLAWGAALTLISIVVILTVVARVTASRFSARVAHHHEDAAMIVGMRRPDPHLRRGSRTTTKMRR